MTERGFRWRVGHNPDPSKCNRGWLVCEPVALDSLGRVNRMMPEWAERTWLVLRCNSNECDAEAVIDLKGIVTGAWKLRTGTSDPSEYINFAWIDPDQLSDIKRRFHTPEETP